MLLYGYSTIMLNEYIQFSIHDSNTRTVYIFQIKSVPEVRLRYDNINQDKPIAFRNKPLYMRQRQLAFEVV